MSMDWHRHFFIWFLWQRRIPWPLFSDGTVSHVPCTVQRSQDSHFLQERTFLQNKYIYSFLIISQQTAIHHVSCKLIYFWSYTKLQGCEEVHVRWQGTAVRTLLIEIYGRVIWQLGHPSA